MVCNVFKIKKTGIRLLKSLLFLKDVNNCLKKYLDVIGQYSCWINCYKYRCFKSNSLPIGMQMCQKVGG